jgi:hypothetical protein
MRDVAGERQNAISRTSENPPAITAITGHTAESPGTPHTASASSTNAVTVATISTTATGRRRCSGTSQERCSENGYLGLSASGLT